MEAAYLLPAESPTNPADGGVHARHHRQRFFIIRALRTSVMPEHQRRCDRICECATWPHVRKRQDGTPCLFLGRCRDRLCPLCSKMRGRECATKVAAVIQRMNAPRFLTLTVRNDDGDLGAQVTRLFECFKDLRRRDSWKTHVKGGVYSLEVTWNNKDETWHPHLHIVFDGHFWPQREISREWLSVTGDSKIVHVAAVPDAEKTAKYVANYVNTPPDLHTWPPDRICEYATAMHGRRVLHTFGSCHGKVVEAEPEEPEAKGTTHVCAISSLQKQAREGNVHARKACDLMSQMGGFWALVCTPNLYDPSVLHRKIDVATQREFVSLCELACGEAEPEAPSAPVEIRGVADATPFLFDVAPTIGRVL